MLSIGCAEEPVFAESIAAGISAKGRVDVSWRSFGVDGGDSSTIQVTCCENVRAVVASRALSSQAHQSPFWGDGEGKRSRPPLPPENVASIRRRYEAQRIWCTGHSEPFSTPTRNGGEGGGMEEDDGDARPVPVDVCVILCGLNDFKKLWKGRTASLFSQQLSSLIHELRSIVGAQVSSSMKLSMKNMGKLLLTFHSTRAVLDCPPGHADGADPLP